MLKASWGGERFPTVSQTGDSVLVEGGWRALGWAAETLTQQGYRVVYGGQRLGDDWWNGWLEVSRPEPAAT